MYKKKSDNKKIKLPVVIPACLVTIACVMSSPYAKEFSSTSDLLTKDDPNFKSIFSETSSSDTESKVRKQAVIRKLSVGSNVLPESPTAIASGELTGVAPFKVTFNGKKYMTPEIAKNYIWNFGDGDAAEGPVVSHTFEYAGTYSVTLQTQQKSGPIHQRSFIVRVRNDENTSPAKTSTSLNRTINISKSIEIEPSQYNSSTPHLSRPESG